MGGLGERSCLGCFDVLWLVSTFQVCSECFCVSGQSSVLRPGQPECQRILQVSLVQVPDVQTRTEFHSFMSRQDSGSRL